jgi:dTDP-4-dehydrorhamnose reductase
VTVYEGIKSFYTEDDETKPVNVYGRSKVVAEIYVKSNYANYAILRSSIIYGPQPFIPLPKTLPLQVKFFLAKFSAFLKIPYIPLFFPHK